MPERWYPDLHVVSRTMCFSAKSHLPVSDLSLSPSIYTNILIEKYTIIYNTMFYSIYIYTIISIYLSLSLDDYDDNDNDNNSYGNGNDSKYIYIYIYIYI